MLKLRRFHLKIVHMHLEPISLTMISCYKSQAKLILSAQGLSSLTQLIDSAHKLNSYSQQTHAAHTLSKHTHLMVLVPADASILIVPAGHYFREISLVSEWKQSEKNKKKEWREITRNSCNQNQTTTIELGTRSTVLHYQRQLSYQ